MLKKYLIPALVTVCLLACAAAKSPSEKVAGEFMDHYYVRTDLRLAQEDCDGLAHQKVEESLRLTEGQSVDSTTRRPRISYRLLESHSEGKESNYLYGIRIEGERMETLHKKTLLKLRERDNGVWKVTQFSDSDTGGTR
jgi:hypothetical protein